MCSICWSREQVPGERARPAAEVADPARPAFAQHGEDGLAALDRQRLFLVGVVLGDGVVEFFGLGVVGFGQPGQRGPGELFLVRQVAPGDELLLRVAGQPVAAGPDQLVDLLGGHPVVLRVVEHGQQHVQVVQRVRQPELAGQAEVEVGESPHSAGVRGWLRASTPQPRGAKTRCASAAPPRQRRAGTLRVERDAFRGQVGARVAAAGERGAEGLLDRHREQAGGGVRAVVDVLGELGVAALVLVPPDQGDRVDLEQQRGRAPLRRRLRVEDVRLTSGNGERLQPVRVLVQQVPQVGRGRAGGGDGQQHMPLSLARSRLIKTIFPNGRGACPSGRCKSLHGSGYRFRHGAGQ